MAYCFVTICSSPQRPIRFLCFLNESDITKSHRTTFMSSIQNHRRNTSPLLLNILCIMLMFSLVQANCFDFFFKLTNGFGLWKWISCRWIFTLNQSSLGDFNAGLWNVSSVVLKKECFFVALCELPTIEHRHFAISSLSFS